jgi:hypothetical protein
MWIQMHVHTHTHAKQFNFCGEGKTVIWNYGASGFCQWTSGSSDWQQPFLMDPCNYFSTLSSEVRQAKFPKHLFFQNVRCQTQSKICNSKCNIPFSEPLRGHCNFFVNKFIDVHVDADWEHVIPVELQNWHVE